MSRWIDQDALTAHIEAARGPRTRRADEVSYEELTRRLYRCRRCKHETLTVGSPLPDGARCRMWRRFPGHKEAQVCGGTLRSRFLTRGRDAPRTVEQDSR